MVGVFVLGGVIAVGAVLCAVHLLRGGELTVPFTNPPKVISLGNKEKPKPWAPPAGKTAVPVAARNIPAYKQVLREDLLDLKTQRWKMAYLEPDAVGPDIITDLSKIMYRVLAHDKSAQYAFVESDFLPKGTRPGLVAGIPPGMRSYTIELSQVPGLYGLQPGDRFDIVAASEVTADPAKDLKGLEGPHAQRAALAAKLDGLGQQARVTAVVQNGMVISPVRTREVPITSAGARGRGTAAKPIQEVVIAVKPEEVGPITQAIQLAAELKVVARSGRPDDDGSSVTPDLVPRSPFGDTTSAGGSSTGVVLVEQVGGDNRSVIPVPKGAETEKK